MGSTTGAFYPGFQGDKDGIYKANATLMHPKGDGIGFKASSDNAIYNGPTFQNSALRLLAIIKI